MGCLQTIPLKVADDTWQPPALSVGGRPFLNLSLRLFLPLGLSGPRATERPAGLFDPISGRMVGYLP